MYVARELPGKRPVRVFLCAFIRTTEARRGIYQASTVLLFLDIEAVGIYETWYIT